MKLTPDAEKLIAILCGAGYKSYAVGGCVRDFILERPVSDIDICTSALPNEVEALLEQSGIRYIETGLKHGTVTAVLNKTPYEITTFRTDGEYLDNRRPESVRFVSDVSSDLARRDFTVNAIAYNADEGFVDLYGGREDIKKGIIRCVGDPDKRFNEDALRIMRALRFSSVLGFEIEENTRRSLFDNRELLNNIAAERIFIELTKLLLGKDCERVLLEYREIIAVVIPELKPCFDCSQVNRWHIYDVYTHTVKAVAASEKKDYIRFALLLHDIAKPQCKTLGNDGFEHFYRHPKYSAEIACSVLKGFRVSNAFLNKAVTLVELHDAHFKLTSSSVKKWLRRLGPDLLLDLCEVKKADLSAHNPVLAKKELSEVERAESFIKEVIDSGEPYLVSDLKINGRDLIDLGYEGKAIQKELERLIADVSDIPALNVREKLLIIAEKDYNNYKE
ncbi:MAG: HD domain-containing protein [Eubacterium sp.]|nr:HD domain-containing protein [Eubacterium sp.]